MEFQDFTDAAMVVFGKYLNEFRTRKEAKSSIFEYIEVYYNRQRSHSSLGFVSPECYEQQLFAKCG